MVIRSCRQRCVCCWEAEKKSNAMQAVASHTQQGLFFVNLLWEIAFVGRDP